MARYSYNFGPVENKTITWTAAANSQNVEFTTKIRPGSAVPTTDANYNPVFPGALQISNRLSVDCFVEWGTSGSVAATVAGSYQVSPGAIVIVDVGQANWVAVIPLSSTTGSVYLSRGLGH